MGLSQLVYVSRATAHADPIELADLAHYSSDRNAQRGVTGVLLFVDGFFIQGMEGEAHILEGLFSRIQQDPRHCDCHLVSHRSIRYRELGDWGMALLDLHASHLSMKPLQRLSNIIYSELQNTSDNSDRDFRMILQGIDRALLEANEPLASTGEP